ncbi:MAG TPA: hypothetical protein VFW40_02390 [Capsulimonadaceae bacterium]|nr:hypothetical protein [Capsulimonadaceae bacterium]
MPYSATVEGRVLSIRINDFPDEELYTLIVDQVETLSFSDWPSAWRRTPEL